MTAPTNSPVFIGCSHGTDDPAGRASVRRLLDAVRRQRPGLDVREAFVDVQVPGVAEVVASIGPGRPAVIVPLLLSAGYHVHVDIAGAADSRPDTVVASALGPDPRLADLVTGALVSAHAGAADDVVLAAAGSSDPRALADVHAAARLVDDALRTRFGEGRSGRTTVAYAAGGTPGVRDAVADLRNAPGRIAVASYLLAPGYFASLLERTGADVVTPPLLAADVRGDSIVDSPADVVARVALDRFDAARST
ncbi:sirohydrochlorin chelatase [Spelaeicoccus albus]|uniref:Sirohydrochlorin ferrochelatase n=1 Tax=Spelaeicoccus albus TaxID=1280376 RepID=A0A7Z0ACQ9_9MICO|nr:CbiX/SirB N-terminal domain-containing protein [Spelaeicoccus albus]NYI67393.1 sirohydrochlorin ferrochelatase [Spelaeicoccus albus]